MKKQDSLIAYNEKEEIFIDATPQYSLAGSDMTQILSSLTYIPGASRYKHGDMIRF